jgi:3-methyladenine DNA glycosylase/8-oxoguanine DNA glycosylase
METMNGNPALDTMIDYWKSKPDSHIDVTGFSDDPHADLLVREDLFAFLMACCIDRGGKSTLIWRIPYKLKQAWGHLDPRIIRHMEPKELAANPVIAHAPGQISKFQIAKTIISLAGLVESEYEGCPERLLEGSATDIMDNLQDIFGVGPNIARMVVILRVLYFGLRPVGTDRLLPKMDVHVKRVMHRIGVVPDDSERSMRRALSGYSNEEIAAIDQVCWEIGQSLCTPTLPKCDMCPLTSPCAKAGVSG